MEEIKYNDWTQSRIAFFVYCIVYVLLINCILPDHLYRPEHPFKFIHLAILFGSFFIGFIFSSILIVGITNEAIDDWYEMWKGRVNVIDIIKGLYAISLCLYSFIYLCIGCFQYFVRDESLHNIVINSLISYLITFSLTTLIIVIGKYKTLKKIFFK